MRYNEGYTKLILFYSIRYTWIKQDFMRLNGRNLTEWAQIDNRSFDLIVLDMMSDD